MILARRSFQAKMNFRPSTKIEFLGLKRQLFGKIKRVTENDLAVRGVALVEVQERKALSKNKCRQMKVPSAKVAVGRLLICS